MCVGPDARPPLPPVRGAAIDARDLTLDAADGARVAAFAARAERSNGAGIIVLPDVRSLIPFYEELALRFAEAGIAAIAIDYFTRSAGTGKRTTDFDYQVHMGQIDGEALNQDIAAAAAYLRSDGGQVDRLYTVGFCFGGRVSFLQAARAELAPAGVIGFYGWPTGESRGLPAPADVAGSFTCPVLAFFGGADQGIPAQARDAFSHALERAGVPHDVIVYPNATHSFFDRRAEEFADASADAWRRMLAFMAPAS